MQETNINLKNLDAVIFDMDGLLLDTETIALETFQAACREYRFEPDLSIYYQCIGGNATHTREVLIHGYGSAFPYNEVVSLWRKRYDEETHKAIPLKSGVLSLLKFLEEQAWKKAVVTSSNYSNALIKLTHSQLLHYFDFVLGGDQISRGKPDPEMYLTACRKLEVEPGRSLALEDSENGVRSALKAGLVVVQVPDLIEPSAEIQGLGHTICKSLDAVETILRRKNGKL